MFSNNFGSHVLLNIYLTILLLTVSCHHKMGVPQTSLPKETVKLTHKGP